MPKALSSESSFVLWSKRILNVFWIIKAPTNIAIPANTLSIVLKKSSPCLMESACSAAASWAFITFRFSESKFVISVLTSLIS